MTLLTQKQLRQSIADAFSRSVERAYKDLLDAAVLAEREACAKVCDGIAAQYKNGRGEHAAERSAAAIRARSKE